METVPEGTDGGNTSACGNGVVDPGELCDTAIPGDQVGVCPATCDDSNPCTDDAVEGGGTCSARCTHGPVTACNGGDGCCPSGCTSANDSDCSPSCGNGAVDPKELCDTKIPAGQPGACPTSCDDGIPCTQDTLLNSGSCSASCTHEPVTACKDGDGCCPSGCTSIFDNDCSSSCGNGALEPGELCDTAISAGQPGACPSSCDDGNPCSTDTLLNGGTCSASCSHSQVMVCKSGDGCCPSGCTSSNDNDCSSSCGNGALEPGEQCDTGIPTGQPGACPASCDDGNPCTKDTLYNGGTCDASCAHAAIAVCKGGDGCCPTGCTSINDSDCSSSCGNGALEPGEQCDTAISAGQPGSCPTSCDDSNPCTTDTLLNGGTCSASCSHAAVGVCKGGDGCCPSGCTSLNDNDCSPSCGNGALEPGEQCDTAISAGQPGSCPTSCNDSNPCTADTLLNGGTCSASCSHSQVTACKGSDGCCPSGCTSLNDSDCSSSCGNGALEPGEQCDTAIPAGQSGACPTSCNDGNSCTTDTLLNGGTCSASCSHAQVTACKSGDGCCPSGCTSLTDGDCSVVAGTCASAQPITLVGGKALLTGSTAGLSDEFATLKCGTYNVQVDGPQAYYKVYLDSAKTYRFALTAAFKAYIYVFSASAGCAPASIQQDCQSSGVSGDREYATQNKTKALYFRPAQSGTYLVAVDSSDPAQKGAFSLEVETLSSASGTCSAAQTLSLGAGKTVISGTNALATDEFPTLKCGGYLKLAGPQVYTKFYLSSASTYRFRFEPDTSAYLVLFLSSVGCTESAIEAACASKSYGHMLYANGDGARTLYFKPSTSGTYTMAVDSAFSSTKASFTVEIEKHAPDIASSTCAGASTLALVGGTATVSGDTFGLANEFGTGLKCGYYSALDGPQKYHRVAMTAGKLYELDLASTFDGHLYIASPLAGCNAASIEADCASDGATGHHMRVSKKRKSLSFTPQQSGLHTIAVESTSSSTGYAGAYSLTVREGVVPVYTAPLSWSFEGDCKGLAHSGDWECGKLAFIGNARCWSQSDGPKVGHSGQWAWGTTLNGCHVAADASAYCDNKYPDEGAVLSFRVSIPAGWSSATLSFWSWDDYQLPYDATEVRVDGVQVYQLCTGKKASPVGWTKRTVSLSAHVGKTVRLDFQLEETASVQYSGWYIDDLSISGS